VSTVAESKKIEVRNSLLLTLNHYKKRVSVSLQAGNPFDGFQRFLYTKFFAYFDYLMLSMSMLASVVDINLMNFGLFAYNIAAMALPRAKANTAWVYYVFIIDLFTLVKYAPLTQSRPLHHAPARDPEQHRDHRHAGHLHDARVEEQ
jgi:hypothetical protein